MLTWNEEANIARTLARLSWARLVVVVDSGSTDETQEIAESFPNVDWHERAFDTHAAQWNHAVGLVPAEFRWTLALDADYYLTEELVRMIVDGDLDEAYDGFSVEFGFRLDGEPIRCSVYPPSTVLFRRTAGRYIQDGHTNRLETKSLNIKKLGELIIHDDRKPFDRWFRNQPNYALREADPSGVRKSLFRRLLRRIPLLASAGMFFYIYLFKGGLLDGKAGLDYASRMAFAEFSIALAQLTRGRTNQLS